MCSGVNVCIVLFDSPGKRLSVNTMLIRVDSSDIANGSHVGEYDSLWVDGSPVATKEVQKAMASAESDLSVCYAHIQIRNATKEI